MIIKRFHCFAAVLFNSFYDNWNYLIYFGGSFEPQVEEQLFILHLDIYVLLIMVILQDVTMSNLQNWRLFVMLSSMLLLGNYLTFFRSLTASGCINVVNLIKERNDECILWTNYQPANYQRALKCRIMFSKLLNSSANIIQVSRKCNIVSACTIICLFRYLIQYCQFKKKLYVQYPFNRTHYS